MADAVEQLAGALGDLYRLERELGRGGMATVYLAHDLKHDRDVALKVLRPELIAVCCEPDRFLVEIRVTARLSHPHILPLLDSGDAEGTLFYVMPYVDGGSLRSRLRREVAPALDEVVALTRQVASALDYAHAQGVIHRDIKPENILLHRGEAVVADFGIARAIASAATVEALTRTGFPLGTPGYMSPEQAAGLPGIDGRSDVFGLACVVYELLVGGTPERWPSDEAGRLGRFVDASAPHRQRLDRLTGRLEQALVRALAVRPDDRFPTAGALADALAGAARPGALLPESEVRRVLDRAAELEAGQPTMSGALTLGQVEQVAAQVGIPPEHVRAAVARPTLESKQQRSAVVRLVPRRVTGAELERLVAEIQSSLGIVGHASIIGGSLTWSPAVQGPNARQIAVTISGVGAGTEIRVEERIDLTGDLFFVPPVGAAAGGILGLAIGSALGLAVMGHGGPNVIMVVCGLLGGVGGGLTTASGLIARLRRRREPQLVALADRLAALLERGAPES